MIKDVRVMKDPEIGTDHYLIRTKTCYVNLTAMATKKNAMVEKVKVYKIRGESRRRHRSRRKEIGRRSQSRWPVG